MDVKGGGMALVIVIVMAVIGGYCTLADPIQTPEKRIFCNMIGCASKRSRESMDSSLDAFEAAGHVAHKKDLSAENLWPRPVQGMETLREKLRQAWVAEGRAAAAAAAGGARRLQNTRGRHPQQMPSAAESDLSFWREMQGWPAYQQRVRRGTQNVLSKLWTRNQRLAV